MILITNRSRKWPPIQPLPKPEGVVVIDTKKPPKPRAEIGSEARG